MSASPEEVAGKLLARHGVTDVPVPVDGIAEAEGGIVVRKHHDCADLGFVLRDGGRVIIGVNTFARRNQQRSVVAHLLGHMLLHMRALVLCSPVRAASEAPAIAALREEGEANSFAGALLMPGPLLGEAVAAWTGALPDPEAPVTRDDLVTAMARAFGTGKELAAFRLITLGLLAA